MGDQVLMIDGIKWWISTTANGARYPIPLCPSHSMRLEPKAENRRVLTKSGNYRELLLNETKSLKCTEDNKVFKLPRSYEEEKTHVLSKVDATIFANMNVINLDDTFIPVAKDELKDSQYWVKSKITKSKSGDRLIIWAGNKDKKNKTQLFVEPEIKRLSFDQNDDHPMEVFTVVEATFAENIKASLRSDDE